MTFKDQQPLQPSHTKSQLHDQENGDTQITADEPLVTDVKAFMMAQEAQMLYERIWQSRQHQRAQNASSTSSAGGHND